MNTSDLVDFFAWCCVLNYSILLIWFVMFSFAHDWLHLMHGKWFELDKRQFDLANYWLIGCFKLLIFVFCLAPYIALRIISQYP